MAVVEISRIQVRRGQENQTGVPTLAGGEFGWAADTEHLYIGLRKDDGGARDANVRILTENDLFNIISTADTSYEYRGNSIGVQDGKHITATDLYPTGFIRSIRDKEDDTVSIKDFGVYGDKGSNEDVAASFQLAINNLFLEPLQTNGGNYGKHSAKVLHLPAGIYNIDTTIYIPKYTTLVGEGIGKTIINLTSNDISAFQTKDSNNNLFPSIDSGVGRPSNIHIEGMTIQYSTTTDKLRTLSLLNLDCSQNTVIRNVGFVGNSNANSTLTTTSTHIGINLRGTASSGGLDYLTTENLLIDNCQFTGLYHGIYSDYDVKYITIQQSLFQNSVRGISFNDDIKGNVGPCWGTIKDNLFKSIGEQAIYCGFSPESAGSHHISTQNKFYDVGNYGGGELTPYTSIIKFFTEGNSSINDYFDRQEYQMDTLGSGGRYYPLVEGRSVFMDEFVRVRGVGGTEDYQSILVYPTSNGGQQILLKYNLFYGDYDNDITSPTYKTPKFFVDRMGECKINLQNGSITDDYTYNIGDAHELTWKVGYFGSAGKIVISVRYIPPNTAVGTASMEIHTTRWT